MTSTAVARLTLRQSRRGIVGWLLGMAAITALYAASYRSVAGVKGAAINGYPDALKRALNLRDLTSPAGYLGSTVFGIPFILLVTSYVITAATRAVAGDEETGALDLVLAYPVSRVTLVLARMGVISGVVTGMGATVLAVVLVVRGPLGPHIGTIHLVAATVTGVLLGWCLGALALLISAAVGRRSEAVALSAGVALFAYLAASFLPLIKHLGWLRDVSPYGWFTNGDPLSNGLQLGDCALLVAVAVLATAMAVVALERRDLRV